MIRTVFAHHPVNSSAYHKRDGKELDALITRFKESGSCDVELLTKIIQRLRMHVKKNEDASPVIEAVKTFVEEHLCEDFSVFDIAEGLNISVYYLAHLFKEKTGTTIIEYRNEKRLTIAKMMLIDSDRSISDIAFACGFSGASYFSEMFIRSEKISPSEYRKYHKSNFM